LRICAEFSRKIIKSRILRNDSEAAAGRIGRRALQRKGRTSSAQNKAQPKAQSVRRFFSHRELRAENADCGKKLSGDRARDAVLSLAEDEA
jgi:hypothetical protein